MSDMLGPDAKAGLTAHGHGIYGDGKGTIHFFPREAIASMDQPWSAELEDELYRIFLKVCEGQFGKEIKPEVRYD